MKTKTMKLAIVLAAVATAQMASARELKIPQMPSSTGQEQVVEAVPPSQINPAEYGLQEADEKSSARSH